ncbi:MAG: aspartate kinase [Bacteroidetes bacterium]|nr:MAG: aspartate kinase [Bacteroidota bacterium]
MKVEVFKFGGGSVNSAEGVRNVVRILKLYEGRSMMLVISAMGKTTNALERILQHYMEGDAVSMVEEFTALREYHLEIARTLFPSAHPPGSTDSRFFSSVHPLLSSDHPLFRELGEEFEHLRNLLLQEPVAGYNESYDRVVSTGEFFSSSILFHFLAGEGFPVTLFDARKLIRTDSSFRDARIDWKKTQLAIQKQLFTLFQDHKGSIGLTQGFIGSDPDGRPTTLGREGSDFTAAILGYCMRVKEVTIWKDVPGILNADPKWFDHPKKLDTLSFHEAIELAYFGATVIHPKTIKPLENANITLHVKHFLSPGDEGTTVQRLQEWKIDTPIFIRKQNQVLISILPRDFSFIVEENLSHIFTLLAQYRVKANVMQNSAISFSVCTDHDPVRIDPLIRELQKSFEIRYNEGLELYTIRHYDEEAIRRITSGRKVILEQKSRSTVHLVVS